MNETKNVISNPTPSTRKMSSVADNYIYFPNTRFPMKGRKVRCGSENADLIMADYLSSKNGTRKNITQSE